MARQYSGILPGSSKETKKEDSDTEQYNFHRNHWFAGVLYPGVTLGYQNKYLSLELRGFQGNNIQLFGPRISFVLGRLNTVRFYGGTDLYKVREFEGELTEGDGYMGGVIFGLQKYFSPHFSFTLDSGPYYISLQDDLSRREVDGLEFVINTGINFHF